MAEASILSHLSGTDFPAAPKFRGVTLLTNQSIAVLESDVSGQTLHERMRAEVTSGRWPTVDSVIDVCAAVGQSVSELHGINIVHGDLKPANLVFRWSSATGFQHRAPPTLIDFESSQHSRPDLELGTGVRSGTWGFIAPERYFVEQPVKQSDVFSLSALAWFLFVGRVGLYGSRAAHRIPLPMREFLREGISIDVIARPPDARSWLAGLEAARSKIEQETLDSLVKWPANWLAVNDLLLTYTLRSRVATAAARRELVQQEYASLSNRAAEAIRMNVSSSDIELYRQYLRSGNSLREWAAESNMSAERARNVLEEASDAVSRAIGEASGAEADSLISN